MMVVLPHAHLPTARVLHAAVGERYINVCDFLQKQGVQVVPIRENPYLDKRLACHADLSFCPLGAGEGLLAKGQEKSAFAALGYQTQEVDVQGVYPSDCALNAVVLSQKAILNPKASQGVAEYCEKNNKQMLSVKQGYAKCNVAVVGENALITSDKGIYAVCTAYGMEVLLIRPGFITLKGFDTGFIGGCSGLLDKDVLFFTGELKRHPDGAAILQFLKKHRVTAVEMPGQLQDIGSIIPLTQTR